MYTDFINIKIKVDEDELIDDEKVNDVIISNLRGLIEQLETTNGNMQSAKAIDELSSLEYIHIKQVSD